MYKHWIFTCPADMFLVPSFWPAWPKNVVTWPNLKISLCKICYPLGKFFFNKLNSYPKIYGIFKILKNKASRSICWISAIKEMAKIWHFCEFFHFYPTLDHHKIRTRTDFENPNSKSLDLHLIFWSALKQLFPASTDFTEVIFKIPQISKHFSAMLFWPILTIFKRRLTVKALKPNW